MHKEIVQIYLLNEQSENLIQKYQTKHTET